MQRYLDDVLSIREQFVVACLNGTISDEALGELMKRTHLIEAMARSLFEIKEKDACIDWESLKVNKF